MFILGCWCLAFVKFFLCRILFNDSLSLRSEMSGANKQQQKHHHSTRWRWSRLELKESWLFFVSVWRWWCFFVSANMTTPKWESEMSCWKNSSRMNKMYERIDQLYLNCLINHQWRPTSSKMFCVSEIREKLNGKNFSLSLLTHNTIHSGLINRQQRQMNLPKKKLMKLFISRKDNSSWGAGTQKCLYRSRWSLLSFWGFDWWALLDGGAAKSSNSDWMEIY